jgi:hypothetical protein
LASQFVTSRESKFISVFFPGDIIHATVTAGKKVGAYVGRILCRASGSFDIATMKGRVAGISHKYCKSIHKKDGYSYGV